MMIDEPLALLAEAFGQDAEPATPPVAGGTPDGSAEPAVIAAASPGQSESAIRSL